MTAIAYELFAGRTQSIDSGKLQAEVEWIVTGATDETEVETAALATVPTSLTMISIPVTRLTLEITERLNQTTWKVKATYGQVDPGSPTLLENTFSFDTSGSTQHITQSITNVSKTGPKAADLGGAIGYDGESVNGVDIIVPAYQWTETYWFNDAYVSNPYKGILMSLTGSVNNAGFKGFYAGEALFLGASGSKQGNGWWQIGFKFSGLPNQTSIAVGAITVPAKKGWEYLWIRYGDDVDSTLKVKIKKPVAAYVEKVYPEKDFGLLGIGT